MNTRTLLLALPLSLALHGTARSEMDTDQAFVPAFDALIASAEFLPDLSFDNSPGEMDATRYSLGSFLNVPVEVGRDWHFLPAFDYNVTSLDFDGVPAGFPMIDEDLHKLSLHSLFYHHQPGSRWLYGGWVRGTFASDGDHVDSDDFYFDVAAGAAYVVNDCFLLGGGIAAMDLGNDGYVIPGPGFYWKPRENLDVSLVGLLFTTTWRPSEDWAVAFRIRSMGNSWNIDSNNLSRQVDFRSYSARIHVERRLVRNLWVSAGIGYSFGNRLELRTTSGNTLYHDHMDGGFSASVALRLRTW